VWKMVGGGLREVEALVGGWGEDGNGHGFEVGEGCGSRGKWEEVSWLAGRLSLFWAAVSEWQPVFFFPCSRRFGPCEAA
jgi:hypothetical protein